MKFIITSICFFIVINIAGAQTERHVFVIEKTGQNLFLKSCISSDLYKDNIILPVNPKIGYVKGSKYHRENPKAILNAFWKDDCLMVPYNNQTYDQLKEFILEVTTLSTEDFLIKILN